MVVVVVVVAGEAAAWAGTITDLTTGVTQRSGKTSGLNEPPPSAICRMRRRSTVIVEDPPLARSMRDPRTFAKYPIARFRSSHSPRAGPEGRGSQGYCWSMTLSTSLKCAVVCVQTLTEWSMVK